MHISAIDAPSDQYGAVSDVARPLIHKLNQASMSSSTYESLHKLLVWGLEQLEGNVVKDLNVFNGYSDEKPVTESTQDAQDAQDAQTPEGEGNDLTETQSQATGAENASAEDSGENAPAKPAENVELVQGIPAVVLTLDSLKDGNEDDEAVGPTPAPAAPVAEAPKVVTTPSVKAKAK